MKFNQMEIANKINNIFLNIPRPKRIEVYNNLRRALSKEKLLIFDEKGRPRPIHIMLRPWIITAEQKKVFLKVSQELKRAISKIHLIYYDNPYARKILPLNPREEKWFFEINKKKIQKSLTIVDRLDSNANFISPNWQRFHFVEQNSVGVGGIHYIPAASRALERVAVPIIKKHLPILKLHPQVDTRELLYETIMDHAHKLRLKRVNVGFLQDTKMLEGTEEFIYLSQFFRNKGLRSQVADPRNLHVKNANLYHNDMPIDLLYRDSEVREIFQMNIGKPALNTIKWAFVHNRILSSIAGEFDHKSMWEIFTNEKFARFFTAREHQLFKQHLLWTRLIFNRKTTDTHGKMVDLIKFIEKNKDSLIMKPNRLYGGQGVILGRFVTTSRWRKYLETAVRNPYTKVVQTYVDCRQEEFPVYYENGEALLEKRFVVSGFLSYGNKIAFLTRFSAERIVNVSRKGGIVPVVATF